MQERRTLSIYLEEEDIPSSATVWQGKRSTTSAIGNVLYIPAQNYPPGSACYYIYCSTSNETSFTASFAGTALVAAGTGIATKPQKYMTIRGNYPNPGTSGYYPLSLVVNQGACFLFPVIIKSVNSSGTVTWSAVGSSLVGKYVKIKMSTNVLIQATSSAPTAGLTYPIYVDTES